MTLQRTGSSSRLLWLQLFWILVRVSPLAFGGGYSMIPLLEREFTERRKWMTREELAAAISMAGSAPGGIGVNAAVSIGYRLGGWAGAIGAVLGTTLPTFLIVFALCLGFSQIHMYPKAAAALEGIQAGVAALILVSAYKLAKTSLRDALTWTAASLTLIGLLFLKIHPMVPILLGLAAGYGSGLLGWGGPAQRGVTNEPAEVSADGENYKYTDYYIADGI